MEQTGYQKSLDTPKTTINNGLAKYIAVICANTVPYRKLLKNEKMLYVLRHATVSKDNPSFRGKKAKCRVMCVQCVKGRDYICCSNISKLAHSENVPKDPNNIVCHQEEKVVV